MMDADHFDTGLAINRIEDVGVARTDNAKNVFHALTGEKLRD